MSHKKYREETNCLNCGAEVHGKFCSECGQENIETHVNFFHLVGHFVADYLHFDSKFFRSLVPLFTRPGFLTREYWEGRRMRYIPPLRLFFFVTIIFMLATTYFYNRFGDRIKETMIKYDHSISGYDTSAIAKMHDTTVVYLATRDSTTTGKEMKEAVVRSKRQHRKLNMGVDFVFRNLKYVTFFLLPVYALWFRLLYHRRRPYYIDHVIYIVHVQTFMYITMGILFGLSILFPAMINLLMGTLQLFLLGYVLLSLHNLYHQAWWKTMLKSIIGAFLLFFTTAMVIVLLTFADAMLT